MKFQKILTLALVAAMLLCALCSCGGKTVTKTPSSDAHKAYADGKSAYEIYTIAEAQTNALKAYSAKMTEFIEIKNPAPSSESGTTINMETLRIADLTDAENPVAYYEITYQQDGNILTHNLSYHKDGVTYYDDGENKYHYDQPAATVIPAYENSAVFNFGEEIFKDAKTGEMNNEGLQIEITSSDQSIIELASKFLPSEISGLESVTLTLQIDKQGYLANLTFDLTAESGDSDVGAVVNIEFIDPGKTPTITPPDLSQFPSYEEYQASTSEADGTGEVTDPASGDISDELSEKDGEAVDAAFELFDENYNKKPDYDELYKKACDEYGKDTIDSIIEVILMFAQVNEAE